MPLEMELMDEKDAPTPPKQTSPAARDALFILNQLKPGKVGRIPIPADRAARGIKAGLSRVAKNHGKKVVSWSDDAFIYVKLV